MNLVSDTFSYRCLLDSHMERSSAQVNQEFRGEDMGGCRGTSVFRRHRCENKMLVAQSCLSLCDPSDYSPPGSSPQKSPGVSYHFLLQGIILTQGLNPDFLPCRRILYPLSHQGSPILLVNLTSKCCWYNWISISKKNRKEIWKCGPPALYHIQRFTQYGSHT